MEKLYDRLYFVNGAAPDMSDTILNIMSKAIDDIDTRVTQIPMLIGSEAIEIVTRTAERVEQIAESIPLDYTELAQTVNGAVEDGYIGKNLFDGKYALGKTSAWESISYRALSTTPIPIEGVEYVVKATNLPSNLRYNICTYTSDVVSQSTYLGAQGWRSDTNEYTITIPTNAKYIRVLFGSMDDATLTDADFVGLKLQIEKGTKATTYTEYAMPNTVLTDKLENAEKDGFIGRNLLPYPFVTDDPLNDTLNGVYYRDNGDGSITLNGTSRGYYYFALNNNSIFCVLPATSVYGYGYVEYGDYIIYVAEDTDSRLRVGYTKEGNVIVTAEGSGQVFNNETFYPRIVRKNAVDKSFSPYIPSNKDLNSFVTKKVTYNGVTFNFYRYGAMKVLVIDGKMNAQISSSVTYWSQLLDKIPDGFKPSATFGNNIIANNGGVFTAQISNQRDEIIWLNRSNFTISQYFSANIIYF